MASLATPLSTPASLSHTDLRADELLLLPEYLLLDKAPVTGHGAVVAGGKFLDIDRADALIARYPHLAPIRLPGKLIMPGFIDTHHHLTQSFGKALAFGEPSEIFRRIWVPLENCLDENLLYMSAKLAALESLRGGFTTVCDAGTRADGDATTIAAATQEVGIRCVLGLICNDMADDVDARERAAILARAQQHLARWENHPLVHPSLAISVPEAGSDGMLQAAAALCADAGTIFQTHANEHLASVERSIVQRKMRPIEHLHYAGALGPQTLIAHATLVTPTELNLLRDTGAAVSYNPVASSWKGNAVAPAMQMAALGIRVGLGTDGTRGDAFRLLDAAESAQRFAFGLSTGDSACGDGDLWLNLALRGGANVLRLGALAGEIALGKAADFLLVDIDVPEMRPSWNLNWELVRLANRSQIDAVFVAGKLRLWQGWPLDWDARAFLKEVDKAAAEVVARAPIQRVHAPSWSNARVRQTTQPTNATTDR
ncbi:amidohydrolase family protein [Ralstonia flaminis]|jgi:5-methylthioadenosine/S-adenosylhomocysteine deaminase|uniref:5'-deoxyadenosine deaminase n=1 Tax=Ralstonia flaminis TaxID=3058597 RepID=A0ABM9KAJ7_9RALS|nr:amidohydrolase family protein [Ralstonia sp. LMG 18101]CAJ0822030.1 5'-deoxyadenosine deaminase [Ralstonia sp. LMG 18101]